MLIRSQDKKRIVKALHVSVGNEVSSKTKHIFAGFAGKTFFHENEINIGQYPSEEAAFAQIDKMIQYFAQNPNGVYQMD